MPTDPTGHRVPTRPAHQDRAQPNFTAYPSPLRFDSGYEWPALYALQRLWLGRLRHHRRVHPLGDDGDLVHHGLERAGNARTSADILLVELTVRLHEQHDLESGAQVPEGNMDMSTRAFR